MKLYGPHSRFTTEEFACKCGCGFGSQEADISFLLIGTLNLMREVYRKPMMVTSGARCAEYNKKVGGTPLSAHLPNPTTGQCEAADIFVGSDEDRLGLVRLSMRYGFSRIGLAPTFVHVDVSTSLPSPRLWLYPPR